MLHEEAKWFFDSVCDASFLQFLQDVNNLCNTIIADTFTCECVLQHNQFLKHMTRTNTNLQINVIASAYSNEWNAVFYSDAMKWLYLLSLCLNMYIFIFFYDKHIVFEFCNLAFAWRVEKEKEREEIKWHS